MKGGRSILENLNDRFVIVNLSFWMQKQTRKHLWHHFPFLFIEIINDLFRERQIKEIEASFEACKLRPIHATNKNLQPVEILPLLPDFERYDSFCLLLFYCGAIYFGLILMQLGFASCESVSSVWERRYILAILKFKTRNRTFYCWIDENLILVCTSYHWYWSTAFQVASK